MLELRVADTSVGELRYRARGEEPPAALVRLVGTLIALEVERSRRPSAPARPPSAGFLRDLLDRKLTDRENIVARGRELGTTSRTASAYRRRALTRSQPEEGDWRARVLAIVERGARGAGAPARATRRSTGRASGRPRPGNHDGELVILVPGRGRRAGPPRGRSPCCRELEA